MSNTQTVAAETETETPELHMFKRECEWVVARDVDGAWEVLAAQYGWESAAAGRAEHELDDPFEQLPDDHVMKVCVDPVTGEIDDNGKHWLELTAAEWTKREGHGLLLCTEF